MTDSEPTFSRQIAHPDRRKVVAVGLASLAVLAAAAITMGASAGPSTGAADPSTAASSAPAASADPGTDSAPPIHDAWPNGGMGAFRDDFGAFGRFGAGAPGIGRLGGVEITAIDGSDLDLETVDGWTRTITVTADTEITKGGDPIELGDLAVGDSIRFRQQPNDDGTFSIIRIDVVLPHVAGTVTAVTDTTITVELRGGTTATVHVDDGTAFKVEDVTGTAGIGDVKVGMRIVASGEQNADGSLDASRVLAGTGRFREDREWKRAPDSSPAPDASGDPG
jgi:hypothetical protein